MVSNNAFLYVMLMQLTIKYCRSSHAIFTIIIIIIVIVVAKGSNSPYQAANSHLLSLTGTSITQ